MGRMSVAETDARKAQVVALARRGVSNIEIAAQLGICLSTVTRYRKLGSVGKCQKDLRVIPHNTLSQAERDALVIGALPLAYFSALRWARRYGRLDLLDDLRSESVTGLVIASARFDESRGNKFATYSAHWVRMKLSRYLTKETIKSTRGEGICDWRDDKMSTVERVAIVEDKPVKLFNMEDLARHITVRHKYVIDMYYIKGMTYDQIGKQMNLTRARIHQILVAAKSRISIAFQSGTLIDE